MSGRDANQHEAHCDFGTYGWREPCTCKVGRRTMPPKSNPDVETLRAFLHTHEFVGDPDIDAARAALARIEEAMPRA